MTTNPNDKFAKIMVAIAVMLVAILEVMDVSIINVALPNMMGSLSANAEQISWVVTSYIVASAIVMLLTGFLVNLLGRKKVLIISISGFLISSCLCGMADNLVQIVIFRMLQGIFGATLVPISQYTLLDSFPKNQHGTAMAIWGIGIMVAPVFGPTLGGLITDQMGWRWTFYVNMPISFLALIMCLKYVQETPIRMMRIDFLGLGLMVSAVTSLQIFLDQGSNYNWFASQYITILFICAVFLWSIFIVRGITTPHHIINFKLFYDRNFTLCTIIMTIFVSAVMGVLIIQPLMLEHLLNYSPTQAGMVLAPRGLTCAIGLSLVAKFNKHIDMRLLAALGIILCAIGSWILSLSSITVDSAWMMMSASVQGLGMGMVFVPISMLATQTLKPDDVAEGTGIFNFGRSLGSSLGVSIMVTLMAHLSQVNWNNLSGHLTAINPALHEWLGSMGVSIYDDIAPYLLGQELARQSSMLAYNSCYYASVWMLLFILPLLFFCRQSSKQTTNSDL